MLCVKMTPEMGGVSLDVRRSDILARISRSSSLVSLNPGVSKTVKRVAPCLDSYRLQIVVSGHVILYMFLLDGWEMLTRIQTVPDDTGVLLKPGNRRNECRLS